MSKNRISKKRMNTYTIQPSKFKGVTAVPPSKSHTLRALLFALMARGTSTIHRYLPSPDTEAMICAITHLGAKVRSYNQTLEVVGVSGRLQYSGDQIDAGNSGQVFRFIAAFGALCRQKITVTGDQSIRTRRPIKPLLDGLQQLGVRAENDPISVCGPVTQDSALVDGEDSQPVSALLMMAAFLPQTTTIKVINPGEKPWIDLTLFWLKKLGVQVSHRDYETYTIEGHASYPGFEVTIPGDWSSAAYPIAAALVTRSEVCIENLDPDDVQGDKKLVAILRAMGAKIVWENRTLCVYGNTPLRGIKANLNDCIDMITILPVVASFAESPTELTGARIARFKESDRIEVMATELRKMGGKLEEREDGLIIFPSPLKGSDLMSHSDHRVSLALAVAAFGAEGSTRLHGVNSMLKSYPQFKDDFIKLGGLIC